MKQYIAYFIISIFILSFGESLTAQQYPISAQVIMASPNSVYLDDYTALGSEKLMLNLALMDSNEPEYDVMLKISIEGSGILLETNPNYSPPPITLLPGMNTLYGSDLSGYLNPRNLLAIGIDETEFRRQPKLPEGMYTICVEVMDYRRRDVMLANEHCGMATLQYNNPPTNIFPACEAPLIVSGGMQAVKFQWQANHDMSLMTQYRLTVVEVNPGINPNDAINGVGTPMLDGELVNINHFTYGPDQVPFEHGKTYAYRVDVYDETGFTTFENEGLGEVCSFTYGTGVGGSIDLTYPSNDARLKPGNPPVLQWNAPSNALAGTPFYYKIRVVPFEYGTDPEQAFFTGLPYVEEQTELLTQMGAWSYYPSEELPAETQFVWKVEAYIPEADTETGGDLLIAESALQTFLATPVVDQFKVNDHLIEVITTNGTPPENLSGVGRVILVPDEEPYEISFSNLNITLTGKGNFLYSGTIDSPVKDLSLPLDFEENGDARFNAQRVILDRNQFKLEGQVQWDFPHAVDSETEVPQVKSKSAVFDYQDYQLKGKTNFNPTGFNLLDPYDFQVHYNEQSIFEINNFPKLKTKMAGYVALPEHSQQADEKRVHIVFEDADNPFWFYGNQKVEFEAGIHLIENTSIKLLPKRTLIDLSEDKSAFAKVEDNYWKGVIFEKYDIVFPQSFDQSGQLVLHQNLLLQLDINKSENNFAYCDSYGMNLNLDRSFPKAKGPTAAFNGFLDNLTKVQIKIEEGSVTDSHIDGYVYVPFLSQTESFDYQLPLDNEGLQAAFLEGIEGFEMAYNEDEKTEIQIVVNHGHFEENNRLSLNIDVLIPEFNLEIFAVDNFTIWGNGNIGFDGEAGKILDLPENIPGSLGNTFPLNLKGIGFAAMQSKEGGSTGYKPSIKSDAFKNIGTLLTSSLNPLFSLMNDEVEVNTVTIYASIQYDLPMGDDLSSDEGGSPETATVIPMGEIIVVSSDITISESVTIVQENSEIEIIECGTSGAPYDCTEIPELELPKKEEPPVYTNQFGAGSSDKGLGGEIFGQIHQWNNDAYTASQENAGKARTYSGASDLGVLPVGIGIPPVGGLFSVTVGDMRYTNDHPYWGTMFGMKVSINLAKPKRLKLMWLLLWGTSDLIRMAMENWMVVIRLLWLLL